MTDEEQIKEVTEKMLNDPLQEKGAEAKSEEPKAEAPSNILDEKLKRFEELEKSIDEKAKELKQVAEKIAVQGRAFAGQEVKQETKEERVNREIKEALGKVGMKF